MTIGLVSQVCIDMKKKHVNTGNSCYLLSQQIDISDLSKSKKLSDSHLPLT